LQHVAPPDSFFDLLVAHLTSSSFSATQQKNAEMWLMSGTWKYFPQFRGKDAQLEFGDFFPTAEMLKKLESPEMVVMTVEEQRALCKKYQQYGYAEGNAAGRENYQPDVERSGLLKEIQNLVNEKIDRDAELHQTKEALRVALNPQSANSTGEFRKKAVAEMETAEYWKKQSLMMAGRIVELEEAQIFVPAFRELYADVQADPYAAQVKWRKNV
jgi:hypothetical protein